MIRFAPLTPELRARLAQSRSRSLLCNLRRSPGSLDRAVEAALAAGPNIKAVGRAARRIGRDPAVVGVSVRRDGSACEAVVLDRRVAETDFGRFAPRSAELRTFESTALVYRQSTISWRKRRPPVRRTTSVLYVERHAVTRFLERGPLDPRRKTTDAMLRAAFDAISVALIRANLVVEAAYAEQRLDRELAATFPVACPVGGGLWVLESSASDEDSCDAVAVTYIGAAQLTGDQHAFITMCGDGDLASALAAYPEALRRDRIDPATHAARLRQIDAALGLAQA
jgi:hypothetical protein